MESLGYKMLENCVGSDYIEVIHDLASQNQRNLFYVPSTINSKIKLQNLLPHKVLQKLVQEHGGQRYRVSKTDGKLDCTELKRRATEDLMKLGYSEPEICHILSVRGRALNDYLRCNDDVVVEDQMALF